MPRQKIFYGWYIAGAGAGSTFLAFAFTTQGFGVFIREFQNEFGWSVGAIALGFSIRSLEQGFLSPITGYLVDRFGSRKMALAGVFLISSALFLLSRMHSIEVYYAASVLMALGLSVGSWNAYNAALMVWFYRKRGVALGVMSAGGATAYLGALILGTMIEFVGWRSTLMIISVVILGLGTPLALVVRRRPEDMGYLPDGVPLEAAPLLADGTAAPVEIRSISGLDVGQALRTPAFYLLALAQAASATGQIAWITFMIPHMREAGFSVQAAGLFAAAFGLSQVVLRFAAGWLGDRIGRRFLFMGGCVGTSIGIAMFSLISVDQFWLLPAILLVFGLGNAGNLIGSSSVAADYFGTKRFATIRGLMASMTVPVGITVPLLIGWMVDRTGTYELAFQAMAGVSLLGVVSLLLIRRPLWNADTHVVEEAAATVA